MVDLHWGSATGFANDALLAQARDAGVVISDLRKDLGGVLTSEGRRPPDLIGLTLDQQWRPDVGEVASVWMVMIHEDTARAELWVGEEIGDALVHGPDREVVVGRKGNPF